MRRQVKPFVTEYRGSPRRNKDLPSSGDLQPEMQPQRSRSFADAERAFHAETSDDSYEAALRAADALFASSPPDANGAGRAARTASPASRPIDDATDEPGGETFEPHVAFAPDGATLERESAPRRILQAIEAPVEDRFAALEAERAPKRRGRKPGSKNKPKIVVGDDWPVSKPLSARKAVTPPALRPAPARFPDLAPSLADLEPEEIGETPVEEDALPRPRGRTDKFGWKRAGLRPGERWKRRLPKAAR